MPKTCRKGIREKAWGFDQRIPSNHESAKAEKAARRKQTCLQTMLNRFNWLCVFFKQKHVLWSEPSKLHSWLHCCRICCSPQEMRTPKMCSLFATGQKEGQLLSTCPCVRLGVLRSLPRNGGNSRKLADCHRRTNAKKMFEEKSCSDSKKVTSLHIRLHNCLHTMHS